VTKNHDRKGRPTLHVVPEAKTGATSGENLVTPKKIGSVPDIWGELGGPMLEIELAMIRVDHGLRAQTLALSHWKERIQAM
jgi:hypothetical protein